MQRNARVQNYELFMNQQRKLRKNLEGTVKMPIFSSSNIKFNNAAEYEEQARIETTPFKSHLIGGFYFSQRFLNKRLYWGMQTKSRSTVIYLFPLRSLKP